MLRLRVWFFIAGKTKGVDGAAGSRLKAFDKELTDTSKKALKSFRQRLVVYDGAVCKMTTLLILWNICDKEYQENRAKCLYYIEGGIVLSMGLFWTNIYMM